MNTTKEYRTWKAMLNRCDHDPNYAGRGVKVCSRWRCSYKWFLSDMGRAPSDSHSIDRINPHLGYSPTNCRWATKQEQAKTRKSNRYITANGKTMTMKDWERETGINDAIIGLRINAGWMPEHAVSVKVKGRGRKSIATGTIVKVTSVSTPPDVIAWAKQRARAKGKSVSKLVCDLIERERRRLAA